MGPRTGHFRTAILLLPVLCFLAAHLAAQQDDFLQTTPRVVATTPTLDQRFVPPGPTTIQVQFDRPMSQTSWSWCGSGPRYPEIVDAPRFVNETTAELPVLLKPEHTYALSINCGAGRGFVSADGVPAQPTPMRFTTGSSLADMVQTDSRNLRAWQEFRTLFATRYSHLERTGFDWQTHLDGARGWMLSPADPEEFAVRLAILMEPAQDVHLYVRLPDDTKIPTHRRRARWNGNDNAISRAFADYTIHNDNIASGRQGDVGYLAIASWSLTDEQLALVDKLLGEFAGSTRALVLDVRGNGGGDETQARRVAGWFLDEPRLYARNRTRDPEQPEGWSPMRTRWVQPRGPEHHYGGRVFVLQGPVCLSSNEAFLMMMRQAPRATSLGEPSGGSSGNPRRYELPNGLQVVLPSWQSFLPDGTPIEGTGVPPQEEVTGSFAADDPVLARALELAAGE